MCIKQVAIFNTSNLKLLNRRASCLPPAEVEDMWDRFDVIWQNRIEPSHRLLEQAPPTHAAIVGERSKLGITLEAPIPKMSGLVKKISPFSKRKNRIEPSHRLLEQAGRPSARRRESGGLYSNRFRQSDCIKSIVFKSSPTPAGRPSLECVVRFRGEQLV